MYRWSPPTFVGIQHLRVSIQGDGPVQEEVQLLGLQPVER